MRKVAYTNHIGRTSRDTHTGKNTAICNLADLAAAEKHNNHDYTQEEVDRMQSDINLDLKGYNSQYVMVDGELVQVDGHIDLEANVRKIYEDQFASAIEEYNLQQIAAGHPGRQIQSYIDKVSDAKQQEVAVEGLIQFGSLEDWEGMSMEDKQKVVPLLLQALKDTMGELKQEDAEFILAGASIHLNEGSPHLHYVGVPVQHAENAQKGLKTRVKKTAVFTQDTLGTGLQDNVRAKIEPQLMTTFGWEFEEKKAGRNKDLTKNQIANTKLQERIGVMNYIVEETQRDLGERLQRYADERIDAVLCSPAKYHNALFLLAECDDGRLSHLDREGRILKEKVLQGRFQESKDPLVLGLEKAIHSVNSDQIKLLTWEQRQDKWNQYQELSKRFWNLRREMNEYVSEKYRRERDARRAYYETLYFLEKSEGLLSTLIGLCFLLYEKKKLEDLKWGTKKLSDAKALQWQLQTNTANFATFSREYREDLKAGKMPYDDCLDSMAAIVREMDRECQAFRSQGKKHVKSKDRGLD